MLPNAIPLYIGFDAREAFAYQVCKFSLLRRTSIPIRVEPLVQRELHQMGLYRRSSHVEVTEKGATIRVDDIDGKPFSTEFSFTRFLVPALQRYRHGWAVFCDCDFLFTADIAELLALADPAKAVMVVKHKHVPGPNEINKMDGQLQQTYFRKNWSSLTMWNVGHPANRFLTVEAVNTEPGSWLHGFSWLKDGEIGELPLEWNWLSGVNEVPQEVPKGIHFTLGGPWFADHRHHPYGDLWTKEAEAAMKARYANK